MIDTERDDVWRKKERKRLRLRQKRDGNKETGSDRYGRWIRHRQKERDEETHIFELRRVKAERSD